MQRVIVLLSVSLACGADDDRDETGATPNEARGSSGDAPGGPTPITVDAGGAPAAGAYGERAPLLAANSEMAVTASAGKIYVLGGYPATRDVQTTVQVYDPAADTWRLAAPMPVPTHHPVAVGVGDRVYSLGGQLEGDVETARAFVLDTVTDVWTELAPLPTARGGGAGVVVGDLIYVVGGRPPAANAFEVYDVAADRWTVLPELPTVFNQRNHLAAAAIAGRVYVAGGRYDGGGFGSPMTDSLDVYDPASAVWSSNRPMLRPRGGVNGVLALGCFHVWGGEGSNIGEANDVFPDHDVYDPVSDSWTSVAPLPVPIHGVTGGVFLDGLIYMPGGGTASGGNSGSVIHQVYRVDLSCGARSDLR